MLPKVTRPTFLALFLILFVVSCASVPVKPVQYQVGEYSVYIADEETVAAQWAKVNEPAHIKNLKENQRIKGFINFRDKEIWSVDDSRVIIHEFKHMIEGSFHGYPEEEPNFTEEFLKPLGQG